MTNLEKYKDNLEQLIKKGERLQLGFLLELNQLDRLENKEEALKKIKPLGFQNSYES